MAQHNQKNLSSIIMRIQDAFITVKRICELPSKELAHYLWGGWLTNFKKSYWFPRDCIARPAPDFSKPRVLKTITIFSQWAVIINFTIPMDFILWVLLWSIGSMCSLVTHTALFYSTAFPSAKKKKAWRLFRGVLWPIICILFLGVLTANILRFF